MGTLVARLGTLHRRGCANQTTMGTAFMQEQPMSHWTGPSSCRQKVCRSRVSVQKPTGLAHMTDVFPSDMSIEPD